jgi:hypothetical protein
LVTFVAINEPLSSIDSSIGHAREFFKDSHKLMAYGGYVNSPAGLDVVEILLNQLEDVVDFLTPV